MFNLDNHHIKGHKWGVPTAVNRSSPTEKYGETCI